MLVDLLGSLTEKQQQHMQTALKNSKQIASLYQSNKFMLRLVMSVIKKE